MNGLKRYAAMLGWVSLVIFLVGGLSPRSAASEDAATTDILTIEDVARLRSVGAVVISPDGAAMAYTLSVPRDPFAEDNGPAWVELHVVGSDGVSRPFVTGEVNVGSIAWAPDGRGISFLAKRKGDDHKALYLIPIDGGEARRVLAHDNAIGSYTWNPDGRSVAFLATESVPEDVESLKKKGFNQEIYEEDQRPTRVWVAEIGDDAPEPRMLELDGSASSLEWSPDGENLALALAPTPLIDDRYMRRKVHVVNAASGKVHARFNNPGKIGALEWSPDGRHLAVISAADFHDPREGRLTVGSVEGGDLEDLMPGFEGHVRNMVWTDNETIRFLADQGVESFVGEVARTGGRVRMIIPPETEGDRPVPVPDLESYRPVISSLSLADNGAMAMRADSPESPSEVFTFAPGAAAPAQLTVSNPWLAEKRLARQEVVEFEARDGLELQGMLIHPLDEKPGERYPLILTVHGGPESHYRNGWLTSYSRLGQVFAARGFAVFYPNYRASTGRGVAFSKLDQGDPAGKEFDDLVDAVDHLVAIGLVDRSRVGVTGGSYGGYASAWCATYHTEHFAASVMFVGLSDMISKIGTTDIPNEMIDVHFRKKPWDHWQFFLERSPIYYAGQSRTPTLILHGKDDPRVNPGQSRELYRHLKMRSEVPVRLILYPGEKHGNSKAAARLDYSLRLLRWMEHYLVGPGGDPPPYELEYPGAEESESTEEG